MGRAYKNANSNALRAPSGSSALPERCHAAGAWWTPAVADSAGSTSGLGPPFLRDMGLAF